MTQLAAPPTVPLAREPVERRLARGFGWFLVGFLIWIARLLLPIPPAPPELDPSWQQGLSHALAHGFQFGREILFTFGPLGGVAHGRFQPEIFWLQIVLFEFLFKGMLVCRWIQALKRWPGGLDRAAFVLMLCTAELGADAFFFATLVAIASLQLDEPAPRRARLALDLLLIAVIAFIKFTYFLLAAGVVGVVVVHFALRAWRSGLVVLGMYAGVVVAVWCACGQAPWNLPIYLVRAMAVASGYSEAQAYDGPLAEVQQALLWILLLLAIAAGTVIGSKDWRSRLLACVVVLGGTYVAFKASFTYHSAHGITFFGFGTLSLCALLPAPDAASTRRILLGVGRAASYVMCLAGLYMRYESGPMMVGLMLGEGAGSIYRNCEMLSRLPTLERRRTQNARDMAKTYGLPRMRAIVGSAEIDMVSSTQSWLLLNGMNWKPRPVFQSYVTVGPSLLDLNERFYQGPEAPEYVLLELGTIDKRLNMMEDSGTLAQLLHGYAPVEVERGLVLVKRDPKLAARPPFQWETLAIRDVRPGEELRIDGYPGRALRVRMEVRYSWLGSLRKLLYHAPITFIQLELDNGGKMRRRLMPGMVSRGVILRPYIEGNPDWVTLYTRGLDKSVAKLVIGSSDPWDKFYQPEMRLVIERCDDVIPEPKLRLERDLAFGSFPTKPIVATSGTDVRNFQLETREVALVGPRSTMGFALEPGPRRLTGSFGMFGGCYKGSDGVVFSVAIVTAEGREKPLYSLLFVPEEATGIPQPLDVAFDAEPGDRLKLSTSNPGSMHEDCDLAFWENIRIE